MNVFAISGVSRVPVCRGIFHMCAYPHLSWIVSFSIEACRSSLMVWVLCRTSLSFCSCCRVSANSPRTACSCSSRTLTRWTQFSLSASQRWSFSSRSATVEEKKYIRDRRVKEKTLLNVSAVQKINKMFATTTCHTDVTLAVEQALCLLQALLHAVDLRCLGGDIPPQTLQLGLFRHQLPSTLCHL